METEKPQDNPNPEKIVIKKKGKRNLRQRKNSDEDAEEENVL